MGFSIKMGAQYKVGYVPQGHFVSSSFGRKMKTSLLTNGKKCPAVLFFSNIVIEIGRVLLFRKNFPYWSVNIFYGKLIFP